MDSGPANTELSLHSESQSQQQDQWKERWEDSGVGRREVKFRAALDILFLQHGPQGMTKIVNRKTAGLCSATELSGKSRLQGRMSRVKDIVRICIHV